LRNLVRKRRHLVAFVAVVPVAVEAVDTLTTDEPAAENIDTVACCMPVAVGATALGRGFEAGAGAADEPAAENIDSVACCSLR
jgi:hypothetical protein